MNTESNRYQVKTWRSSLSLFWILNPGSAIVELVFGQRVPKKILVDKSTNKPLWERVYYPCPHCETLNDSRTWSSENNTDWGNWFGLYCPNCGKIIPCLTSLFSFLLLVLCMPFWLVFRKPLKRKWLARQAKRYVDIQPANTKNPFQRGQWIQSGVGWGLGMFIVMGILFPLVEGETLTLRGVGLSLLVCIVGGILYALVMKVIYNKKPKAINTGKPQSGFA